MKKCSCFPGFTKMGITSTEETTMAKWYILY